MATFVPFKAFRPVKNSAKAVASRPYDVLSKEEARLESAGNPISFYHVIKPEIDFPDGFHEYAPEVYRKGKENFDKLVHGAVMVQDKKECFYVYQIRMGQHRQTGLVGCCSIDDYFNDVIKKHEKTRPDKEEDRKNHIRASKLHYEAVLFSYPQVTSIDQLVDAVIQQPAEYDFVADDGTQHLLWVIDDTATIGQIVRLFEEKVENIYIADGHHRTAAGALVGQEFITIPGNGNGNGYGDNGGASPRAKYFMAVLFPENQLQILDYNRVVKDLGGISEEAFLHRLEQDFEIEPQPEPCRPKAARTFGMYLAGQWYKLTARPGTYDEQDPVGQLDVTILSNRVLEPILNIVDLRTDKRIDFVGGMRGLEELEKRVDSGEMKVAFSLYPVSMRQLVNISNHGMLMPPKVTWFEPKLRSGLFVHSLNEEE